MSSKQSANSQQPAASSQRPAASSQQPAASSQQPAASSQQPAASGQHLLPGKVMGLDLGGKRIGVAVSDASRMIARSYGVLQRKSRQEDFARFNNIIAEQKITLVVMGLPVNLNGTDSATTTWVRDYTAELAPQIPVPVVFWDESFSSQEAAASLQQRGKRGKKQKERLDAVAAAFILQSYLDAHYEENRSQ